MAIYFCGLCGKKLGFLEDFLWLDSETILCSKCTAFHKEVEESMDEMDEKVTFETKREEFKKRLPKEKHVQFIKYWNNVYNKKIQALEKEQKEREKEQKEREEEQKRKIEAERKAREEIQKAHQPKMDNLTQMGLNGYYEYKVVSLLDESGVFRKKSGTVDTVAMTKTLNDLGVDGWRLVTAYSNELGKNALSGGVGGAMLGTNSTVDENILIFERFVKISKE